ncbi:MAG TPA: FtsK/SpoIIIE domain-containing protein [Streptosporangiaceae bacterium]|nr:FtsK/SpoIIIE domain-containing protein [Streptosporangiaceae bacterium]
MSTFSGDQIAQVNNPDPFAAPVWRSPVYHTPGWVITVVQLWRLLAAVVGFIARHPVIDLAALALAGAWYLMGWPGAVVLVLTVVAVLVAWRHWWPGSFARFIASPARGKWRRWHYQRHWAAVMTIGRLAPVYQGRLLLPVLGKVSSTRFTDRVLVGIVSGQSAEDFDRRAGNLAHGFAALTCRVRTGRPGWLVLEFVRRDALAAIIAALPVPARVDLRALAVGRREDGSPWLIRLHGTHLLIAGATGAGKGSVIWGLIRALLPALHAGLVRILAADPKVMELAYGRAIFDRYGEYAADAKAIVAMLEQAATDMQARAAKLAGRQRDHIPAAEHPFVIVLVDEVAFLTAYHPDKPLRERVKAALATLTTQGRAVGYCVVAALQDPRKKSCRSATCSPTGSRCGWTNPSRWTWCSATAPATAAPPLT